MNLFPSHPEEEKTKEQIQYLAIMLLAGIGYYLFFFLPEQRTEAKKEIKEAFNVNSPVTATDLDASLWKGFKTWQERLDKFYLPSQISKFKDTMQEAIETRKKEVEEKKFRSIKEAKEQAINDIQDYAKKELGNLKEISSIKKVLENFSKRINRLQSNDISSIVSEANAFIDQAKIKKKKLHWRRESSNWADKKLEILKQAFNNSWAQYIDIIGGNEPEECTFTASYTICFPPSLWNKLTNEQKKHKKVKKLDLDPKVDKYTFNPKIDNWYEKALVDPVRGERDKSKLDNNAALYGTPRTGKSIIVEKLAYKSDKYPLVVIQGSALTPNVNDQKCNVDNFNKFIFTICDINNTLVDDFGFERNPKSGEPQYIFFIDEANQVSENTFVRKSSGLTFLKECMGSDNYKKNESHNLWIIATNHLSEIDEAVYQPGRLANQLNFSWTLGKFKEYADDVGITSDFPQHWMDTNSLSEEDNKWISRFNVILFEESFLGRTIDGESIPNAVSFWDKFISNEDNKKILNEEKETNEQGEEVINQKGIQLGELLQFFWQKFDSGELWDKDFDAKFESPREPKIHDIVVQGANKISESIDKRLKELDETTDKIRQEIEAGQNDIANTIDKALDQITTLLSTIASKID